MMHSARWLLETPRGYHFIRKDDESGCNRKGNDSLRGLKATDQKVPTCCFGRLGLAGAAFLFSAILIVGMTRAFSPGIGFGITRNKHHFSACPVRHEWRTLNTTQQQSYIQAFKCLLELDSSISSIPNMTAYDNFPWIHSRVGYFTHNSAAFLPWHRYFLHIYETTLREICGYEGSLAYWDWTLDYRALEHSPVFDPVTGFGGDGEVDDPIILGSTGRCVTDGPFANLQVKYYDVEYQPHCLSRGFRNNAGELGHIDGEGISPESIEEVLGRKTYEEFVELMEVRIHDAIPMGIGGDFETFTAPFDPLFFLHHTQLDRLWWLWQQRQADGGLLSYGGIKERYSNEAASLEDYLYYRELGTYVQVKDVMDIKSQALCYDY